MLLHRQTLKKNINESGEDDVKSKKGKGQLACWDQYRDFFQDQE